MSYPIEHDESKKRFFCTVDNLECSADYDRKDSTPTIIDIYKTFVHPDLRGKGIAEDLLVAISEFATAQGLSIMSSCSYAVVFYRRHPQYASLLAKDVDLENGGSCRLG